MNEFIVRNKRVADTIKPLKRGFFKLFAKLASKNTFYNGAQTLISDTKRL
jgi:hypothetical protein